MNISEFFIDELLFEDFQNKTLLNQLIAKWGISADVAEKYADWFFSTKERFNKTTTRKTVNPDGTQTSYETVVPQISKFLARYPKFPENDLKDITKYSAEQINFLYAEYNKEGVKNEISDPVFLTNSVKNTDAPGKIDRSPNFDKIVKSKSLWFNDDTPVIKKDGFRVYKINSQQESINFGYYLSTMYSVDSRDKEYVSGAKFYGIPGSQWCTTWWNNNNMYAGKRRDRLFYFIIDESKSPELYENTPAPTAPDGLPMYNYYLSTLQILNNGTYILTPIRNGEPPRSADFIFSIYPQLRGELSKLSYQKMSDNEITINRDRIYLTEAEVGPPSEFAFAEYALQLQYILDGGSLTKSKSWIHLDEDLKKQYIGLTNVDTISERFSTFELLYEIKKTTSTVKTLNYKLNSLKNGLTMDTLFTDMIRKSGQFTIYRRSVENNKLEIWVSVSQKKYCIFDVEKSKFLEYNGVQYNPEYILKNNRAELYLANDGKKYFVESFIISKDDDPKNFYSITEVPATRNTPNLNAWFFTHKAFIEFKDKNLQPGNSLISKIEKIEPGDIK